MTNNIGFKEKMWGYLWEGVYDPWRVKERVLNETFATLENLPDELKPDIKHHITAPLRDKIRYDDEKKLLFFDGIMTEPECDELKSLSKDKYYIKAIENIRRVFLDIKSVKVELDINITNLDDFKKGRSVSLEGHIKKGDVYYEGKPNSIKNGKFKLFSKDPDTHIRRLEYEMPFSVNGQDYFLYGHKEVADDPAKPDLLEILQDLTTCFLTLYEGETHDGPMLGTGIMEFHTVALPEFVSSLLPRTGAKADERSDRRALLEYIVDNLRDTYSTLNYAAPQEFVTKEMVKDQLNELDRFWFGVTLARDLSDKLYNRDDWKAKLIRFIINLI